MYCPLVTESGITRFVVFCPLPTACLHFLEVMENSNSFLKAILYPSAKEGGKGLKRLVVSPGPWLCLGSCLPELVIAP